MSQPFTIPHFTDEELEFRPWYLKLPTAREHLLALQEWRRRQSRIVGSLGQIIGHFGGEQYTEVDHFLLELLQNADDNSYEPGVTPTMAITLESDRCIFTCNEVGFSADNVFSVCYAAASTKKREPGKRSYIGEKGIGFKSLFAVAEAVEIHSGDYHFELRDQEYIVPHLLPGTRESGSRIVVRFRSGMEEIASLLSKRLSILAQSADHFVLFLQKLEVLTIADALAETSTTVKILRADDSCVVQQGNEAPRSYRMVSETIDFPEEIVHDRFKHLSGPLQRDVRFAVPFPEELKSGADAGLLFCFLPTRVKSGFPFHIQLDGKTTTNRENIESAARSKWNKHLLDKLPLAIIKLFVKLRNDQVFSSELPLYFPDPKQSSTGNDDLSAALNWVAAGIQINDLGLDRKNKFRPVGALRTAPIAMAEWVETDQFAKHLGKYQETECEFLHPTWRKHRTILANFGCATLSADQLAALFVNGGCPASIASASEEKPVRDFLDKWITLRPDQSWEVTKLKAAPIYPVKDGQARSFAAITDKTLLVSLDGRDIPVPSGSVILDPNYTYSPGGNIDETVRGFNERFRAYLTGVLKMERYSDAKYLEDVLIPSIQLECAKPVTTEAERLAHTERWLELFNRVWWREKTIVSDSSPDRFQKMLGNIGQCQIVTGAKLESGWVTVPLKDAFLPTPWWQDQTLAAIYEQAGAPIIALVLDRVFAPSTARATAGDSKVNPQEWIGFFTRCGAAQGPRLIDAAFPSGEGLPESIVRLRLKCDQVSTNWRTPAITTVDFDSATGRILAMPDLPENLTLAVSRCWEAIARGKTQLSWSYRGNRSHAIDDCAARCRALSANFLVLTDSNLSLPALAALDTDQNRSIGRGLIPLVDVARYGSESFLLQIGVSEKLDEAWLESSVQAAVQESDDSRFEALASRVMRMAARLARFRPEGRTWIRTAKIFAHRSNRTLLTYDEWIEQKGEVGFPENVAYEVLESLESVAGTSVSSLINELFDLGDLAGRQNLIVNWLKGVGSELRMGRKDEIALEFANQLRNRGLVLQGQPLKEPESLPALWNVFPNPCSTAGFIVLPDDAADRSHCLLAASVLNWPKVSARKVQIVADSLEPVDAVTLHQIQLTAEALDSIFSNAAGRRPAKSELLRLAKAGQLEVFGAKGLALKFADSAECPEVNYWFSKSALHFDSERVRLADAIGSVIDAQASTTVTPFIPDIFDRQETPAKQAVARLRNPQPIASPAPSPAPALPTAPLTPPPSGNNGGSNPPPPEPPAGVRRRLYSYVVRSGDGKVQPKKTGTSSVATKAKTDVEQAGEKMLTDFCARHGLGCKDVTADNVGYDFEITSAGGNFLVELKSSRDRWDHWENAMTPNEFKSAMKHQENYLLCVAELVLDSAGSLSFIQNPCGQADYFLFDSPWKKVAIDPKQLFSIMEDAIGAPPPRCDE